jgi:hypothetical protein
VRVSRRSRAIGIRDHPIALRSSWQNGQVERLIGWIRRECLDYMIVFGETLEQRARHKPDPNQPVEHCALQLASLSRAVILTTF